jgi:hypothetical protein
MPTYNVTVRLPPLDGYIAADAELDGDAELGDHVYVIEADSPAQAEELGLDRFHETVAIGLLEAVDVSARASPAVG